MSGQRLQKLFPAHQTPADARPMLEVEGWKIPSCCTTTGKCGLNGGMTYGCTSLEDASATIGAFVDLPMPQACTPAG